MRLLNLFVTTFFLFQMNVSYGQVKAITEDGDTIYVFDNGTWSFDPTDVPSNVDEELSFFQEEMSLDTSSITFVKPPKSKGKVVDKRELFEIHYDDSTWKRIPPGTINDDAQFAFQGKNADIWCIVISEETSFDKDKLFILAQQMMKDNLGSTPEIINAEIRNVNGTDILRGTVRVKGSGIVFVFDTYYYTCEQGSVQFTTWSGENVWQKREKEFIDLLNGFVALQ